MIERLFRCHQLVPISNGKLVACAACKLFKNNVLRKRFAKPADNKETMSSRPESSIDLLTVDMVVEQ